MQEFIKEEIKIVADKISFLRNILLAVLGGIVGILFGITQNKINLNFGLIFLLIVGIIFAIIIINRINLWESKRKELVDKLKEIK